MSYSHEVRELAFDYYCAGMAADAIAARLKGAREDCAEIGGSTIERWESRYNWRGRRREVQQGREAAADSKRAEELQWITGELREILERLLSQSKVVDPRTLEGTVQAALSLLKVYGELTGMGRGGSDLNPRQIRTAMERFRRALGQVPAFRQAMTAENMEALAGAIEVEFAA